MTGSSDTNLGKGGTLSSGRPGNLARRWLRNSVRGLFGPFQLIKQNPGLVWVLLKRDIESQTSGTMLGAIWVFAQPALQVLAFWFLLAVVLQVRMPGQLDFIDYFLMGMLPWFLISSIIQRNLMVLTEFSSLYQRSVFPIKLLPLVPLLFIALTYAIIWPLVAGILLGWAAAARAFFLVGLIAFWLVPISYLIALLGLFVRDARHVVPFVLTMVMFLTPILYVPEQLSESIREFLILNPFADIMAIVHFFLQHMPITAGNVVRPWVLWFFLLAPAWVLFERAEPHMREEL
jgi:lipopolysaccharide transport system permease protein